MSVFLREAKVVASVDWDALKTAVVSGHVLYHDRSALPPPTEGQAATPLRYIYGVQIVDERGQKSAASVPQEISLEVPPAAPLRLKVEPAEGEVRLRWESGETGAKGELYNVYRRPASQKEEPLVPLNPAPMTERTYVDLKFDYGETYRYSVRSLRQPPPPLKESAPSEEVEVRPLDVYPPKAPTGLAAAVEGQAIKLYWFPNSEPDLRGYRVYRREAKGEPQKIGEVDAAETSYADTTVIRGVRYYYSVSAVDRATPPNESARSEEVSESMTADTASPTGASGR
jgi:fibronectin type 3 domain-containing protein